MIKSVSAMRPLYQITGRMGRGDYGGITLQEALLIRRFSDLAIAKGGSDALRNTFPAFANYPFLGRFKGDETVLGKNIVYAPERSKDALQEIAIGRIKLATGQVKNLSEGVSVDPLSLEELITFLDSLHTEGRNEVVKELGKIAGGREFHADERFTVLMTLTHYAGVEKGDLKSVVKDLIIALNDSNEPVKLGRYVCSS